MNILLICGSIGERSCTRAMLQYLQELLEEEGVTTRLWDLGEQPLPIAVPRYHYLPDENPSDTVNGFTEAVRTADGFVLGSPLYHGSFSGVLKNALDSLPPKAFASRPVALVSHSGNARSCVAPCDSLRPVVRSLSGYSMRTQIGTTDDDYRRQDDTYRLVNRHVRSRAAEQAAELVRMAALLCPGPRPRAE